MSEKSFPYHEVKRVFRTGNYEYANQLIAEGWILLDLEKEASSADHYLVYYVLGNVNEVEEPESDTQRRKRMIAKIAAEPRDPKDLNNLFKGLDDD
ncbi:MAG: hypothetical protein KJ069_15935 [Anaerolineae bacterium]|nr:hypothetical protein [Anaerolineae bacterium]